MNQVLKKKKNYNNPTRVTIVTYTSEGKPATPSQIENARTQLTDDLDQLKDTVKLKDSEIERLNQEISNLQTLVQIESLKSELANLKMLANKEKQKRAARKK